MIPSKLAYQTGWFSCVVFKKHQTLALGGHLYLLANQLNSISSLVFLLRGVKVYKIMQNEIDKRIDTGWEPFPSISPHSVLQQKNHRKEGICKQIDY